MQTADPTVSVRIVRILMLTYTGTNIRGYLHWQSKQKANVCNYQLLTVQKAAKV